MGSCERCILVLDDEKAVTTAFERLLLSAGYRVKTFQRARDLLASPLVSTATCLLLDHHMPDANGIEVLQRLRASGVTIPVIIFTGRDAHELSTRAVRSGAFCCLTKPIDSQTLLSALEDAESLPS